MTAADYTWGVWPEPQHVRELRADLATATAALDAVRALCVKHRAKDGRIPCAAVEAVVGGGGS